MLITNLPSASFGSHLCSLRRARGLTQETLAERSDLAPDTIRKIENAGGSPRYDTLTKLARGLDLRLSTMLEGFELGEQAPARELADLFAGLSSREFALTTKLVRVVLAELAADGCRGEGQMPASHASSSAAVPTSAVTS